MQIKTHNSGESSKLRQEDKFSSFTEMLDQGWSLNHQRENNTLIGTKINEIIDVEISRDSLSKAKLTNQNIQN